MTCGACGKDLTVAGCSANEWVLYGDNVRLPTVPFAGKAGECCAECGAQPGHKHHVGCPLEICPRCRGLLNSCGCSVVVDGQSTQGGKTTYLN